MNIVFISIAISIVMINIALTLQISLRYDLLKNLGKVQLRLFGILLFSVPFTFVDKYCALAESFSHYREILMQKDLRHLANTFAIFVSAFLLI